MRQANSFGLGAAERYIVQGGAFYLKGGVAATPAIVALLLGTLYSADENSWL